MNKVKLKCSLLTLALLASFSLTACGGGETATTTATAAGTTTTSTEKKDEDTDTTDDAESETPSEKSDNDVVEGGDLKLWHIHTADSRKIPIEEGIKRFEEDNPGVNVDITVLENDPYKTKLKTVMGSGDAPDIFHSWGGGWLKAFVDEGLVVDMTDYIKDWEDDLNKAYVDMVTYDGKVYGSSLFGSSTLLYYNKDIFNDLSLTPPETYEELMEVCETLKSNGIIPFALGNKSKWPGAQHFVLLSMRLGGADIFQRAIDGEVSFTDDVFIQAGEMLQDMVDKGYFPDGMNGINYDTGGSRMMFYQGQTGMILQTSGFISSCKTEAEDFYNDTLGAIYYPSVEGGTGKPTDILSGSNTFSIASNCEIPATAAKLIGFLSTDIDLQTTFAINGSIPARIDVDMSSVPLIELAAGQVESATFLQNFIDQTLSPELSEKHKDTCQALFGKTMTPLEAAEEMQALFDSSN